MAKEVRSVNAVISTKRQQRFLEAYCKNGYNREQAERSAGLAARSGYHILEKPEVQALIHRNQRAVVIGDLYPKAIAKYKQALDPKSKFPYTNQIQAANAVRDMVKEISAEMAAEGKETGLTPEQQAANLAKEIDRLTAHAASMAKTVSDPSAIEDAEIIEEGDIFE